MNRTVRVIGIAGGIGSGKSAVARSLSRMGATISDSDAQARELLSDPVVVEQLVGWWGPGVLHAERGTIDRAAVARIVFADPTQRKRLESLIHPVLAEKRRKQLLDLASGPPERAAVLVVDAPLLFEAGIDRECDGVVFVDASRELRLSRVVQSRGWTADEFDARERAQMDLGQKRSRCDWVVVNIAGERELDAQVKQLWPQISGHTHPGTVCGA